MWTPIDLPSAVTGDESSDAALIAYFRTLLPDIYFVNTPVSRMRRHLELLRRLPEEQLVIDCLQPPGAHFSELTLCAYDDAEPGLLSKVAGTLTALGINVHTAWVHTVEDTAGPEAGRNIVLDTLILSETFLGRTRPLSAKTRKRIFEQLKEVLSGETPVVQLLMRKSRNPYRPLAIYDLSVLETEDKWTVVYLRAADDPGVLYRVTRAAAKLGLNIAHAQIDTQESSVEDFFFVSGPHGKLSRQEAEDALTRLRDALLNDSLLAGK